MAIYVCSICGYTYDEAVGIPEAGIAPGTKYEDLPEDWACPLCGAAKSEFMQQGEPAKASAPARERQEPAAAMEVPADLDGMTALEMSALCSNLARGCEKQYKQEEAALFNELASYFKNAAAPADGPDPGQLAERIDKDLAEGFPQAFDAASGVRDRGALRALTWSDKVTRIHKSLLARYLKEGDAMLEKADVFVCSICGFVHIGAAAPDLCPVCKVPNWKFEKIEGRS